MYVRSSSSRGVAALSLMREWWWATVVSVSLRKLNAEANTSKDPVNLVRFRGHLYVSQLELRMVPRWDFFCAEVG
jgi:hypothetical protein